jgi:ABC-2 type transport system permease protein
MKETFKEIRKHLRVYRLFAKTSLMQQLEYRANFVIGIAAESAWLASKLIYSFIVHRTGTTVGGLSPDEITLFIGTFIILTAIYTGMFMMNFFYIPWRVQTGDLDLMVVKPISTQFHLTMREVDFAIPIPNIIGGFITLGISWSRLGLEAGFVQIMTYACLIISGTVLTYSIFLLPYLLSFWTVKVRAITEIADRMWDFNNMPMQIYGKWMQRVGIFVIPVFVIANFPVMALFDNLPRLYLIWGVVFPLLLFVLVKFVFDFAIKRYSSAGG